MADSSSSGSFPPSEGGDVNEREESTEEKSTEEKFERYKIKGKGHVERVGEWSCGGHIIIRDHVRIM